MYINCHDMVAVLVVAWFPIAATEIAPGAAVGLTSVPSMNIQVEFI